MLLLLGLTVAVVSLLRVTLTLLCGYFCVSGSPRTFSPGLFDIQFCFCCCWLCCAQSPVMPDSLRPMDCSPPGSSVYGILQARILEWVAMPSTRGSSQSRNRTHISSISCIAGSFFTHQATWEALIVLALTNFVPGIPCPTHFSAKNAYFWLLISRQCFFFFFWALLLPE